MILVTERRWLVIASLSSTVAVFLFFILAPALGYPLIYEDALEIVQIVVPVFMGYLGTAAQFVFAQNNASDPKLRRSATPLLRLMVRGPIVAFVVIITASLIAYGYTNRSDAPMDSGMSLSLLSAIVTASLALLTVTTNAAVAYLFAAQSQR